jgi:hypothetical protein
MISTFYDDLFAFDMERKRWYKLGLKQLKLKAERVSKEKKLMNVAGEDDHSSSDVEDDDCSDENIPDGICASGPQSELFGYIDESGNVVYIELDESEGLPLTGNAGEKADEQSIATTTIEAFTDLQLVEISNQSPQPHDNSTTVVERLTDEMEHVPQLVHGKTLESLETSCQPCPRINPSILIR